MRRFVEGADRGQGTLFPECLEDWIGGDNPVRVIDVFTDELDLAELGFSGVDPEVTGRPSYQQGGWLDIRSVISYSHDVPEHQRGLINEVDDRLAVPAIRLKARS